MEVPTIIVYTPSSNRERIRLLDGEAPVNLNGATKIALKLSNNAIIDSDEYPTVFQWRSNTEIPKGVIELFLGHVIWTDTINDAELVVFDEYHTRGLFFGFIRIRWIEDC